MIRALVLSSVPFAWSSRQRVDLGRVDTAVVQQDVQDVTFTAVDQQDVQDVTELFQDSFEDQQVTEDTIYGEQKAQPLPWLNPTHPSYVRLVNEADGTFSTPFGTQGLRVFGYRRGQNGTDSGAETTASGLSHTVVPGKWHHLSFNVARPGKSPDHGDYRVELLLEEDDGQRTLLAFAEGLAFQTDFSESGQLDYRAPATAEVKAGSRLVIRLLDTDIGYWGNTILFDNIRLWADSFSPEHVELFRDSFESLQVTTDTVYAEKNKHQPWLNPTHPSYVKLVNEADGTFSTPYGAQGLKVFGYRRGQDGTDGGAETTASGLSETVFPGKWHHLSFNVARPGKSPDHGDYRVELMLEEEDGQRTVLASAEGLAFNTDFSESDQLDFLAPADMTVGESSRLVIRLLDTDVGYWGNTILFDDIHLWADGEPPERMELFSESFEDPQVTTATTYGKETGQHWLNPMHPSYVKLETSNEGLFSTPFGSQALTVFGYRRGQNGTDGGTETIAAGLSWTLFPDKWHHLSFNVGRHYKSSDHGDYRVELLLEDGGERTLLASAEGLAYKTDLSEADHLDYLAPHDLSVGTESRLVIRLVDTDNGYWGNKALFDNIRLWADHKPPANQGGENQ